MKNWQQIKIDAEHGDWEVVAKIAGCSVKNLRNVSNDLAPDNFNLQKIFSEYITLRNNLIKKYRKRRR